jgi:hypothetical protein
VSEIELADSAVQSMIASSILSQSIFARYNIPWEIYPHRDRVVRCCECRVSIWSGRRTKRVCSKWLWPASRVHCQDAIVPITRCQTYLSTHWISTTYLRNTISCEHRFCVGVNRRHQSISRIRACPLNWLVLFSHHFQRHQYSRTSTSESAAYPSQSAGTITNPSAMVVEVKIEAPLIASGSA